MHRSKPTCMGCHGVMDPLGFALENFDTIGQFRTLDARTLTGLILPASCPMAR